MKKIAKISTLICTLALVLVVMFALSACGAGTTYKYSSVTVNSSTIVGGEEVPSDTDTDSAMSALYDAMYKDSTITVSEKEVIWTVSDTKNVMSVTKDGDKYILSGEYVEQIKSALSSTQGGAISEFEMYGTATEGGFEIVCSGTITMSAMGTSITVHESMTYRFVK